MRNRPPPRAPRTATPRLPGVACRGRTCRSPARPDSVPEALGRGAVRRTFTAPADGWYRLAARGPGGGWVVTVVDPDGDGVLASSRWEDDPDGGALVHARAGADLAVLVGAVDGPGGAFELEWRGTAAPTRLRHVGRLVDGGPDARGVPVEIRGAGDLAFGAGRLYLASALGLSEFERDAASGELAFVRLLEADLAGARLAWDAGRARLLAHDCGAWTAFERRADGGVGPPRALAAVGDPARCGRLLVDAAGALVHRVGASGVDTFAVTRDGGLRFAGATPVPGLKGAALGAAGHVYVAAGDALWVIRARAAAARFAAAPTGARLATAAPARVPLAVDAAGERLLAVDAAGARLFALGPAAPDGPPAATELPAAELPAADGPAPAGCSFAAMRPDATVDLICAGGVVTARWFEGSRVFGGARRVGGVPDFGTPLGAAATPDGRYVYVSTPAHGILTFERSTADDHGDDPATATVVAIPSTTAGELGLGDKDYFRIDIIRAGILTFETTGGTDTYGTLYDGDGTVLEEDDDRGPRPTNFGISDVLLFEGTYFVEVREVRGVTGAYELRVTGDARSPATPAATAPSVSINAIPSGNEETTVRLGATLTGGAYDGAVDHAWSVDGGTLDSSSSATPVWTRPAVTSNTNHTVRLTVTVRGTGTNAESGTSDAASANRQALVRDVPPPPPAADAPSVTINTIPNGNENTTVRLGATLTGGTYDGSVEFAWTVTGGRLANPNSATPTWTRPTVSADADHTVRLTVTARGRGTNARGGTSERADANRTARVLDLPAQLPVAAAPSVSINAIPAGNEGTAVQLGATLNGGTHDGALDYAWTVTGGTLDNANVATPTWTRPSVASNTNFTVRLTITARGAGTAARNGTSDTASTSRSAQVRNVVAPLPVAAAPSVSIDAIAAGDEGTTVTLGATLNGGTHDGAVEYTWSANGGTVANPNSATPTWTRPSVVSTRNYTVSLRVTVRGSGTVASNGTSATANASRTAQVRDVPAVLPVANPPTVRINHIPAGDEGTTVQLGAMTYGGNYDGAPTYEWTVSGGTLDSANYALPTWTRPAVTAATDVTVSATVTVRGTGRNARSGSSALRTATKQARVFDAGSVQVRDHGNDRASATTVGAPSTTAGTLTRGDRDWFRIDITQAGSLRLEATGTTDTYGTLYRADGTEIARDDDDGDRLNFLISMAAVGTETYYLEVRGYRTYTTGPYSLEVSGTARGQATLPAATAPSVTINAVAAGDENTTVQLGAALAGGTYDGAPDYAWSVSGGVLDNANAASPTWTRPAVSADANHTIGLTVTVGGDGTNASNGTSDTASASRTAQVRNVVVLPMAAAPAVSINAIPAGNENTTVQLGATLNGGTYDGAVDYAWTVTGGTLDHPAAATPTWTRPSVTSNTNHTVRLTVTARGAGTVARDGSSDTANATFSAQVRNVVVVLPAAAAPSVTIDAIPAGDENTTVRLGATVNGGTYDGNPEYAWSVNGGTLDDETVATPTWTRPSVTSNTNHAVSLRITVRGTGTNARNGTSATANATRSAQVRDAAGGDHGNDRASATTVGVPSTTAGTLTRGDRDWFRIDITQAGSLRLEATGTTDTYGTLYRADGTEVARDDDDGDRLNFSIPMAAVGTGTYYLEVRGYRAYTTGPYNLEVSGTARVRATVPAATAPSVTINAIPAGDENTAVTLGAALAGGTYDGAPDYTWSVSGGTLDNASLAAPTWTRPAVSADANHTVSLTVTVDGDGTKASNGSSDTASTSRTAQVRNVAVLPAAMAPSVTINTVSAGNEGTAVQLGAALTGGTYEGAVEYAWSVTGGTLDDETVATPTWTRPTVQSDMSITVVLGVTVRGRGTTVRNGTFDISSTSQSTRVLDLPAQLPVAAAPSVTIDAIPAGNEGTSVQLGATLTGGGPYDGAVEYAWSVNGGTLDDETAATPTWTRPAVTSNTNHAVSLRITVRGTGTNARNGTSATANATRSAQVRDAAGGDHGNDRASATTVGIPSTTAGTLTRGDRDWFRIDITQAGSLRLEATGTTDTYGTLYRADGTEIARDDDDGDRLNFSIPMAAVGTGTYYLEVRGYRAYTTGPYNLEVSGTARVRATVPAATAPSVTINAIPAGDENTAVTLGAALAGGTYDGAPDYTWSVSGGTLDNASLAAPTWTRPAVSADANHTVSLTVTVGGTGTNASNGTSATANATRTAQVRNVTGVLPAASAPSVSINAIAAGDEGTTVTLGAALAGGTYDGTAEYAWSVNGGTLSDPNAATPTWIRPSVASTRNYTVSLRVTVRGSGTAASNGSSATANASRTAQVRNVTGVLPAASAPSVTINAIPAGDEGTGVSLSAALTGGTYDGAVDYIWNVNGGTLANRHTATPTWSRPSVASDTNYTVRLRVIVSGGGTTARSGTYAYANVTRTAQVLDVASALPVASAPNAIIDYIPGGVGNTTVQLGVRLDGGTYDGPAEYAWESDECVLDDATAAAPVCTRIPVPDNDPVNTWGAVEVTVTVRGTGTNARDGTIDTDRGVRQFSVRPIDDPTPWDDHANGSRDATLVTMPGTMAGSLETAGDIDWFYFRLTSAASVLVETTGSTNTQGSLHFFDRRPIADDGRGPGGNLRIVADLEPGYFLVEVSGQDRLRTGDYTLVLRPRPANSPPTLVAGSLPSAPQAIAGGAPRIFRLDEPITDPDGDFVWLSLSSDDESVATATLQGKALIVHPHTAGTANITVTGHDPSGASGSGSFAVTVSAPTHADPTTAFNAAGDQLTLSFTDQFAPGETRAYQAFVRQKPADDVWNRFCFTASNSGNSTQTQSVSTDLAVTGIAEPGTTYETIYRHLGSSCSDSSNGLWSRAAEATAPGTPSFDIELVFLGTPSAAHRNLVERAAARWERILTMGVPNRDFSDNPLSGDDCWTGAPLVDDVVDDVRVFVDFSSIDGPGGTVGQAGACWIRGLSRIPIIGAIILDADDFRGSASGKEDVVLHELAHALGFSFSHWSRSNLLREPSIHPDGGQRYGTNDTHFAGPLAVAAFDAAGGMSYSGGKVPVSNNIAWAGSRNSHWRESVMDHELMTPTREHSGSYPLSAITIQAMADMGYQVDVSQADAYRLPSAGTSVAAAPARSAAPPLNGSGGQAQGQTDAATIGEACIVMDNAIAIDGDPGVVRVLPASAVRTTRVLLQ